MKQNTEPVLSEPAGQAKQATLSWGKDLVYYETKEQVFN
jgi:hypothetical protein